MKSAIEMATDTLPKPISDQQCLEKLLIMLLRQTDELLKLLKDSLQAFSGFIRFSRVKHCQ